MNGLPNSRVHIVGGGGREHAISWRIMQENCAPFVTAAPGNPGMQQMGVRCFGETSAIDISGQLDLVSKSDPDLVIIGPEAPLDLGLADELRSRGIRVYGPSALAAQIETSKSFAYAVMRDEGVPTPFSVICNNPATAMDYVRIHFTENYVIKADGLAAGKGVVVPKSRAEAEQTIENFMVKRTLGEAGKTVMFQNRVSGQEISYMVETDGWNCIGSMAVQDHKTLLAGGLGPNTGGMGIIAPVPCVDEQEILEYATRIVRRLYRKGMPFIGTMFMGLMLTDQGTEVLEINCRWGDAETEALMPLVLSGFTEVSYAASAGKGGLEGANLRWIHNRCSAVVVMAAEGYPGNARTGDVITGLDRDLPNTMVFHMGTRFGDDGQILTSGGRVLAVTGWGETHQQAMLAAYGRARLINFAGMQYRRDIGVGFIRSMRKRRDPVNPEAAIAEV